MENWDIAWLYFQPSDLCRARISMRCMGGGFRGGGEGTLHLIETQPSIHISTSQTNWTRSEPDARPTARRRRGRRRGPSRGPSGPTAVANSDKKKKRRKSTLFTKTDPLQFQFPHFYISKLRVSVCVCETSPTLKPQRRGRARSLRPPSHVKKTHTWSENVRIHVTYSPPSTTFPSSSLSREQFESIKSEKCCTVSTQTRWLSLVGII